jgi:hypothetical protein
MGREPWRLLHERTEVIWSMNQDTRLSISTPTDDDLLTAYGAGLLVGKYSAWIERRLQPDAWMRTESGVRRPLFRTSKIEALVPEGNSQ